MLLRTLLQLALRTSDASISEQALQTLRQASPQRWQSALSELGFHRQMPLMFHTLKSPALSRSVPKTVLSQLMQAYLCSHQRSTLMYRTLATVLDAVYSAGIYPVLWKGIVLADQHYPEAAVRMLGDIDWAIAPHERETVDRIFKDLGFELEAELTTSDAVYYKSPDNIHFDVHHRVRLFEGKEHLPLTMKIEPRGIELPQFHVLEPNAMLTHLTVHLNGHFPETGPLLFWVLDFVFLLRKWGDQIELDRLKALMPDHESWLLLGQVLRFLQVEFGEVLPPVLAEIAQQNDPLTLESMTRQCRLAGWNLDQPKGWLKLLACRLGFQMSSPQTYPQAGDLLMWAMNR